MRFVKLQQYLASSFVSFDKLVPRIELDVLGLELKVDSTYVRSLQVNGARFGGWRIVSACSVASVQVLRLSSQVNILAAQPALDTRKRSHVAYEDVLVPSA